MAAFDRGDTINGNVDTPSMSEMISLLKSAFHASDFGEIEAILVFKEEKLKHQIEINVKKKELLEEKIQVELLDKINIETKLQEFKRECSTLKELNSQLNKERNEFNDRLASAAKDKQIIIELKRKKCELECAKLRAETEVEVYKRKFEELESRVLRLEKDLTLLGKDPEVPCSLSAKKVLEQKGIDEIVKSGEKIHNVKSEMDMFDRDENMQMEANGGFSCCSPQNGSADMGKAVGSTEEKISKNRKVESGINVGNRIEKVNSKVDVTDCCGSVYSEENQGPNCSYSRKRSAAVQRADGGRSTLEKVVEILDSDNDNDSLEILSLKEMTTQRCIDNAHVFSGTNESGTGMLKRKQGSCFSIVGNDNYNSYDNSRNVDDGCSSSKHKMSELQDLIHKPDSSHVNHFSKATMSSATSDCGKGLAPKLDPFVLRQCEDKIGAEHKYPSTMSEFALHGLGIFDSEDGTSSSDSEDDAELPFDLLNWFRRKWETEAGMVAEFRKDGELCLKAVCALYRQQTCMEKSYSGPSFSKCRGFNRLDTIRGTTLAEFLIDGDPQQRLKKSIKELAAYDPKGLDDCRRLAIEHSKQLFEIYQQKEDPVF